MTLSRISRATLVTSALCLGLGACSTTSLPGGFGLGGGAEGSAAVQPTAPRPEPDGRGVISYPNYQVAVARPDDTVTQIANRLGLDAAALARTNGIPPEARLREGELVLLNERVAATDGRAVRPDGEIDVATLAGSALDRAEGTAPAPSRETSAITPAATDAEPRRHRVQRGETAYSIARTYDVSVRALAEWNGLDSALTVREGQVLLIPVATGPAPSEATTPSDPGEGSPTPEPPSASAPQPADNPGSAAAASAAAATTGTAIESEQTSASDTARLRQPTTGRIIRPYQPGTNEGVDFGAAAGTPVRAAEAGTVAAITQDTDQVPIIVLRHSGDLLTVYANVDGIAVEKGTQVSRGQQIAEVRGGDPSFLHFEVRQGFESVDPVPYLAE